MTLLTVTDLSVTYHTRNGPVTAVDSVNFAIDRGQAMGLVGESGCGKSTIGMALMGMLPANARITAGRICLDENDLTAISADRWRRLRWTRMAMVFQAAMNAMNPVQRISDQIVEAIRFHSPQTSPAAARDRVAELFDQVGLPPRRMDDYPHQYSGGMRQRAIIAMALACRPDLIIADEPTTALDVIVQDQILRTLACIQSDQAMGMLFISHDIAVVADVCELIGVMYAGQLVEFGRRDEVFHQPAHPYTQALLRAHITLDTTKDVPVPIPGAPPKAGAMMTGCRFCDRCRCPGDACHMEAPRWRHLSDTHQILCCTDGKDRG